MTTVYVKKNFAAYDKMKLTIWQMLIGGFIILMGALAFEPVDFKVWLNPLNDSILFYIAVIGTGFAFALWNWIVSQVDTFVASISVMCIPILSLFFGHVLWHEPITINILIGAAFICSGIIFSSLNFASKQNIRRAVMENRH